MADSTFIDIAALSLPLDEQNPCGGNFEYDPQFLRMEQAAQGSAEVEYGDSVTEAVPADWTLVLELALQLMARTRDLRLAVLSARALLNLRGVGGFAAGMALVAELLATQWDDVHPQLDPDDDNDPMLRVNVLAALCAPATLLRELREAPLVGVRGHGSFSLRDLDIASGELPTPAGQEPATLAVIDAAFQGAGQDDLAATGAALRGALDSAMRIEQILTEKVGVAQALDMSALAALLRRASLAVAQRTSAAAPQVDAGDTADAAAAPGAPRAAAPKNAEIASREDVRGALDKLCAYYARHEPSSPVPLLLQRARKLVDMSFTELLQDLAPEGLGQLAQVSGIRNDS